MRVIIQLRAGMVIILERRGVHLRFSLLVAAAGSCDGLDGRDCWRAVEGQDLQRALRGGGGVGGALLIHVINVVPEEPAVTLQEKQNKKILS